MPLLGFHSGALWLMVSLLYGTGLRLHVITLPCLLVCGTGHGAIAGRGDPMFPHQFEEYAPRFTTYAGSFGYIAFVIIQGTLDVLALEAIH